MRPVRPNPKTRPPRADAGVPCGKPGIDICGTQSARHRSHRSGIQRPDPMKAREKDIEIWDLDASGARCALAVKGLVCYVGSRDECVRRAEILARHGDRERQNLMLVRALR